jgi:hypothetical protein
VFLWIVPESITPIFDRLIHRGWASAVWRLSQIFSWMKAFFYHCVCAKMITCHTWCGYVRASLCVVRDLANVVRLLFLNLCVALRIDDMVLNLCLSFKLKASPLPPSVWLVVDEPTAVRRAILSFRETSFGELAIFYFWFMESPSCDSPLRTCIWWNQKVSPSPSGVSLAKLASVS